jgi:xylulokinase
MIVVINLGLKSIRAIAFDEKGKAISSSKSEVTTIIMDDWVEQDPREWFKKSTAVLKECLDNLPNGTIVKKITFTTSASCLVLIDRSGEPLRNVMMVSDKRSTRECDIIWHSNEYQTIFKKINKKPTPDLYLPKILWLKNNEEDIFLKCWKFLGPSDFLAYKFCSEVITDSFSASKFFYDYEEKKYPEKLIEKLKINLKLFPNVGTIGQEIGEVRSEIFSHKNLNYNAKIILSTYDALCSVIGSGVTEPGDVCDVSGTVTSIRLLTEKKVVDPLARIDTQHWFNGWIIGGSNNLGGGLIEWARQLLYSKENYKSVYKNMEKEAANISLGAEGIIFLPYLLGERAPLWNDKARGVFFGLDRSHKRPQMMRSVFESTAFVSYSIIEAMKSLGLEIKQVKVSGGLAQIDLVSQLKANMFNVPVTVQNEFESTALGAFILTSENAKKIGFSEFFDQIDNEKKVFYPVEEDYLCQSQLYELYKSLYSNLEGIFDKKDQYYKALKNIKNKKIHSVLENL